MKEKIFSFIMLSSYSYIIVFFLLVLSGIGLPVPDELVIVLSGYIYKKGLVLFYPIMIFLYFGILLGDIIPYLLGMAFGERVFEIPFVKRYFTTKRIRKLEAILRLYGRNSIIFIRLFFIGIRPLAYAFLGSRKYKIFPQEIFAVVLSLLWFFLGFFFSEHIEIVLSLVYKIKDIVIVGIIIFVIFYLFENFLLKKRLKFFKRIGISFSISAILLFLVFAIELIKFKKYDFLRNESKIKNLGVDFFLSSKKKTIFRYFKKKGWEYKKGGSYYLFEKGNNKIKLFKTGLYLDGKPVWRFEGDISVLDDVEVKKIKTKNESEISVFVIDRIFFK